jgi:SAM-dependent methyltransferase
MIIFSQYAKYYDLLNRGKDYSGEADYVHFLIQTYCPRARTLLDLGCGSGRHAYEMVQKGYNVTGVDISNEMLSCASKIQFSESAPIFIQGDIRSVRLGTRFDVVIALFHVMSYQVTIEDICSVFANVRYHLNPGGIFIFDCWYGPGVLSDPPSIRVKKMEDDAITITRIAQPVMFPGENLVDVHYDVFIKDIHTGIIDEFRETHRMRYFFKPEIRYLLVQSGLTLTSDYEWMTYKEPDFSWQAVFCAS